MIDVRHRVHQRYGFRFQKAKAESGDADRHSVKLRPRRIQRSSSMFRDQFPTVFSSGVYIKLLTVLFMLSATVALADNLDGKVTDPLQRLEQTYREQAVEHEIYRDQQRSKRLVLADAPVYKWSDSQAKGYTGGMVFIWTWQGKPEAIAAIFSNPIEPNLRRISHEFHSLSKEVLRPANSTWKPRAGIRTKLIDDAPFVAKTATARMVQMRSIARRFTGNTIDKNGQRWELRFLPQPLYRSTPNEDEMSDGAVFAFVTSALTDPEAILLLETMRVDGEYRWGYSLVRFSNMTTRFKYKDQDVWNAVPVSVNHNEGHTYQLLQRPIVEETWK